MLHSAEKDGHAVPRSVGYWLLGCSGMVLSIIVVGGVTRLTESGLSITEWKPVTGIFWPSSQDAWDQEFSKYRESPEFKKINAGMNVDDFKRIYFMEWFHRLLGRAIGIGFVLPAAYFIVRKRVRGRDTILIGFLASLIGFQGFLGWYMVKSGLDEATFNDTSLVPRVSQYRLAAHLGTALVLYAAMFRRGMTILMSSGKWTPFNMTPMAYKRATYLITCLVFFTALSGAFVAGLDAGLIYNDFPFMGKGLVPPKEELWSKKPWWKNLFENETTVQLEHRIMALCSYVGVTGLYGALFHPLLRDQVAQGAQKMMRLTWLMANVQVLLGILTLAYLVPTDIAACHQAGSVILLTGLLAAGARMGCKPRMKLKWTH